MPPVAKVFVAVDLGASGGRLVSGRFDGDRITLADDGPRFDNGPVAASGRLYWDLLRLWSCLLDGMRQVARSESAIASIGVDAWGVDFGLLAGDELLGNPYCYRDRRTTGMLELAQQRVSRREIFEQTGVQFMQINTLYQLLAMRHQQSPLLDAATTFLMIPDLFHWLLTGEKANERTDASTTQMFDARQQTWARPLLDRLDLPSHFFPRLASPGTVLGPLRPEVAHATGWDRVPVVLPGSHDTASAVLAVPATGFPNPTQPDWCYISSGTWSLMGVELAQPVINDLSLARNFTNEGGVGDTTRLLKNIAGLWLVQECRRIWSQDGQPLNWSELIDRARQAPALRSLIDPNDPQFLAPDDMPLAIQNYCRRSGQDVPDSPGRVIRCVLESLALCYRQVLEWLEELIGGRIATIHIVGGGSQNQLLCQMAADACRRLVLAGPTEATALGNILMQALAAGDVASIRQARELADASFPQARYEPQSGGEWDEAYGRFQQLTRLSHAP